MMVSYVKDIDFTDFTEALPAFLTFVFMPLKEAQAYFNRSGDVTAIEVYTDNPDRIVTFRQLVTDAAKRPIFMIDWRQRNATFFSALLNCTTERCLICCWMI